MAQQAEGDAAVEFLVEPFVEGAPGDHVQAAIDVLAAAGLTVDVGPFSSQAVGPTHTLTSALGPMVDAALTAGATSVRLQVGSPGDTFGVGDLHDALQGMLRSAQRELGSGPEEWTRADKQAVVRMLDERGAFLLRGAVDDIANVMGVSRITIYNYLNAIEES
jgi:uncharacterized protein YqgV (UPF0045/DUF77 family)